MASRQNYFPLILLIGEAVREGGGGGGGGGGGDEGGCREDVGIGHAVTATGAEGSHLQDLVSNFAVDAEYKVKILQVLTQFLKIQWPSMFAL